MSIGRKSKKKNKELVCIKPLLLAVFLIVSTAVSAWVRPYQVYADGEIDNTPPSYNVAQYIMSLLMSMGCGISNQQVVNSLYQQLGNVDIREASVSTINTAFTNIKNAVNFDFSTMFSSTTQEAEQFVQEVGSDKIVSIAGGAYQAGAADAGTNIIASMKNFLSQDVVMPAVGGATFVSSFVGPVVLAGAAGVVLGFAADKIRSSIVDYVAASAGINTSKNYLNYSLGGQTLLYQNYNYASTVTNMTANANSNCILFVYSAYGTNYCSYYNPTNTTQTCKTVVFYGSTPYQITQNVNAKSYQAWTYQPRQADIPGLGLIITNGTNNLDQQLAGYSPKSPDLISSTGNMKKEAVSGNDLGMPYIQPQYNPTTETFKIIPDEVIQQWIQEAVNNTQGNDQSQQSQDFQTIINNYTTTIPSENPSPEPTSIPVPTITPVTNPIPSPQPTAAPLPEPSQEEQEQLPEGMNQPDWSQKFPFCIPYDIKYFMEMWNSNRDAPYFDFEINLFGVGTYHVIIDFSPFESVASLLRMLELILFIVALALGTRKLLNPGGDG